ncbi:hypothetical protein QE152_g26408 [Popillia japonica]|uniref:Uncharacterized protein n=1 Tax=Popillia japonica TaxID=7064 RepID=A0AAW1JYW2_POPJA
MECSPSTSLSEPVLINISPTQHLLQLSPIPIVTKVPNRRKRQVAQVLNCPTVIDQKKNKVTKALKKSGKRKQKEQEDTGKQNIKREKENKTLKGKEKH